MPKKKRVKRKISKSKSKKLDDSNIRKINLVIKNLILFGVLSLLSLMLYSVSNDEVYQSLFSLISIVLGFVSIAFFIVLMVFLVLRLMKRR